MDYSVFRDRMNYLFEGRGLTRQALAAELGISTPSISRYLSGDRAPDLPYLLVIADYFHVSIDWLLGLEDGRQALNDDMHEVAHLYSISSADDRKVVHAVLDKYRSAADYTAPEPNKRSPSGSKEE